LRKLRDSVVVITGASSGIGRAAALAFARKRGAVVLAARRAAALDELGAACERIGAAALAVPTDVTDQMQVEALARRAVERFGRIDVWVNNAAVALFGRFEDTPIDAFRRVIETNLFGYVYGARAALPVFREQGGGVLINVGSIVSKIPQPYTSPYVMSKHAVRALGRSLRQEIALDGAPIHVCTVMPASIDTPLFQHAANYTGRPVQPMPPVYPADDVAATLVRLARKPRNEVFVGRVGRVLDVQEKLAPAASERMLATVVDRQHLDTHGRAATTEGNLFGPMHEGTGISGGWLTDDGRSALRTAALLLAPAAAAWWWMRSRDGGGSRPQRPLLRLPPPAAAPAGDASANSPVGVAGTRS